MPAIQDVYPDEIAHCSGCGRLNEHGLHLRAFWNGDETVTRYRTQAWHIATPDYMNGGHLASLIDCHGAGTTAAAAYQAEGREPGTLPPHRYVAASLEVECLKPTPLGVELEVHRRAMSMQGRKVVVQGWILAGGETTAKGEIVAVQTPARPAPGLGRVWRVVRQGPRPPCPIRA